MKNYCRYLWIFGIVYTLGIWGFSAYYFHLQVKKMEELFRLADTARRQRLSETDFILRAAVFLEKGLYYNNLNAAAVCNGMSSYYLRHNVLDKALLWSFKEEQILKKTAQDTGTLFFTYSDLSRLYLELNHVKKAEDYILKAKQYLEKYRSKSIYANVRIGEFHYLYGKIQFKEKQYLAAIEFFQEGARYFSKSRERDSPAVLQGVSAYFVGRSYLLLGDYEQAQKYADISRDFITQVNVPVHLLFRCYLLQYQIYEQAGDGISAEKYRRLLLEFDGNADLNVEDYEVLNLLIKRQTIPVQ